MKLWTCAAHLPLWGKRQRVHLPLNSRAAAPPPHISHPPRSPPESKRAPGQLCPPGVHACQALPGAPPCVASKLYSHTSHILRLGLEGRLSCRQQSNDQQKSMTNIIISKAILKSPSHVWQAILTPHLPHPPIGIKRSS